MGWRLRLALAGPRLRAAWRGELLSELARPASSGEAWPEAIAEAALEHPSATVRAALAELAPRLAAGAPLSESLQGLEPLVGAETGPVLRVAERAGVLAEAAEELERVSARSAQEAARLRECWLAPTMTILAALGVAGLLAAFLIPALRAFVGDPPPWPLGILPEWSPEPRAFIALWLGACVLAWLVARLPFGRWPFQAELRRSVSSLLLTRSLARLLGAGVGLVEALETAACVLPAGEARAGLLASAARLAAGEPASETFADPRARLPPLLRAVLACSHGDEDLPESLRRLARFEEAELEHRAARLRVLSALTAVAVAALLAGSVVLLGWSAYFQSIGSPQF